MEKVELTMSALPKSSRPIIIPLQSDENGLLTPESLALAAIPDGVQFPPDTAVWIAVDQSKDGVDAVVGRIAIMPVLCIEGTNVNEDYRGTSLAVRLVKTAEQAMKDTLHTHAVAFSASAEVEDYLKRFGYVEMPIKLFSKELK